MLRFDECKERMEREYTAPVWMEKSGLAPEELTQQFMQLLEANSTLPVSMQKAHAFAFVCTHAQITVDSSDLFQDKIRHEALMNLFTRQKRENVAQKSLQNVLERTKRNVAEGFWNAHADFGHVCPDWKRMFAVGFPGILREAEQNAAQCENDPEKSTFYRSCVICYKAIIAYTKRLAKEAEAVNPQSAAVLSAISTRAPETFCEALQTILIFFTLHENVCGGRDRSLGRLDAELYPFYRNDLEHKTMTEEEIREIIRFFLYKFWCKKVPFDQPFTLCGIDANGNEVTNELSYMFIEEYAKLNIHSPKLHIRVSDQTPNELLLKVMQSIRSGNSSFLLVNDRIAVQTLASVGITLEQAREYIPIGCYEPAAFGCEIPCTGNGSLNALKAFVYAFDEPFQTFPELYARVCDHLRSGVHDALETIRAWEMHYMDIYPDPILSGTFSSCMRSGKDAYAGGVQYNNSSLNVASIASLVDSLCIVKKYIFDEKKYTVSDFRQILKNDWAGNEALRHEIRSCKARYGNRDEFADELMQKLSAYISGLIQNQPNGRGGVFKAGLYSIDHNVEYGQKTGATPDGRKKGDTTSKNLCPTAGMEFGGMTSMIASVARINATGFANGSVLDVVFHPTSVSGEDGLKAMLGIFKTYFKLGGFAMHGNVFDPDQLRDAQKRPDAYRNLQVRVCGWNAYFVNLTKAEQDDFIKQAGCGA